MHCNHELSFLMGTANGIVCRKCGSTFNSFAEIHAEPEKQTEPVQEPEKQTEPVQEPEKPKAKTRGRKKKEDA